MKLQASRCTSCLKAIIPPRETCPYCGPGSKMEPIAIGNTGTVLSYTVLQTPPEGFSPPLVMALVQLEYDARALCLLERAGEVPTLDIGQQVVLSLDDDDRLRFVPV